MILWKLPCRYGDIRTHTYKSPSRQKLQTDSTYKREIMWNGWMGWATTYRMSA